MASGEIKQYEFFYKVGRFYYVLKLQPDQEKFVPYSSKGWIISANDIFWPPEGLIWKMLVISVVEQASP